MSHVSVSQTNLVRETAMWFCEMRQMPRLQDCFYEFVWQLFAWLRGLFAPHTVRRTNPR